MPCTLVASVLTPNRPSKNRKLVRKTIKRSAIDTLSESGGLTSPADIGNGLEKEGLKKDLEVGMNGVKIGPPLRRKQTKQDSPKEVVVMDMSGAKFGPPSRKKRKKQDGSSTTDIDPVEGLTSSTYDRDLMVSPIFTFNDPYKMCGR